MQSRSYGSVRVVYLDRSAVLKAVRQAVLRLARRRPEVQRVVLFGSMARGDAVPGSDVDLLIVLAETDRPFLDRMDVYRPTGIPIGVDVFAYTEAELRRMQEEGSGFIKEVLREGLVLFKRARANRPK